MPAIEVKCPICESSCVVKFGLNRKGKQRYQCRNKDCKRDTFILDYENKGYLTTIKKQIVDMALNGSGIRDTSRVLGISTNTVISELKKESEIKHINYKLLSQANCEDIKVDIVPVKSAEIDAMWSFVQKKENPRWLWHAIDHISGEVLAYVFGKRKDNIFMQLKSLLTPFGIKHFYTDDWGAYERKLPEFQHTISKSNTQKIERKHLTFRTRVKRLARKTICFSKLEKMQDIVIGLFINRYEFEVAI